MTQATEYTIVEKPCIDALVSFGYTWLPPQQNQTARDTLNQVILRDIFITAIQRINDVPEEVARATYQDMLIVTDNEQWTNLLRGNYSRNVPGETTKKTIRLINFKEPEKNTFTVTNQFYVKSQNPRKPDIVIFINGIPLVVLEAKKPFTAKDKTGEAFEQIKQYERDIPRLFYSNAFNIITQGANVLIDDAVEDGATVPIRYTSRKAEWQVDEKKLDILFDNWFANEPEAVVNKIKARGVKIEDLLKHGDRIELLAYDIWTHFSLHAAPEGFKAQIVAIDREAIILYKRELNKIIAKYLQKQGFDPETAKTWADAMSIPVYSSNQEDGKPSEDIYIDKLRQDLRKYALDKNAEVAAIGKFTGDNAEYEAKVQRGEVPPVQFLIVCNKLLTGFDAPRESVMYLDSPLKEHNLLQAIARTNRVYNSHKEFGLIVDYIGVTENLTSALATYRQADVQNAMQDLEVERNHLKTAHAEVLKFLKPISRNTENIRQEYDTLIQHLGTEDNWYTFHRQAKEFIKAYDALSPDPFILDYRNDLKWVAGFLPLGTLTFEKRESTLSRDVSAKIR